MRADSDVRALKRGLSVLGQVRLQESATLAELHGLTGLAKPTLLRLLGTLETEGFVRRSMVDGRWRLAAAARRFAGGPEGHDPIVDHGAPVLEALSRRLVWPSDLAVRDGTAMAILETTRSRTPYAVDRQVAFGYRVHMLASGLGRAYLAFAAEAERREIVAALGRSNDPLDRLARQRRRLEGLLAEVRTKGYALRAPGYRSAFHGLAVPVLVQGAARAAINVIWAPVRDAVIDPENVFLPALREAAGAIAARVEAENVAR